MPSKRSTGSGGAGGGAGGGGRGSSGAGSRGSRSQDAATSSHRKRLASKPPRPVPPEARSRAAERTLRLRGEVAIGRGTLAACALGLFLIGVVAGAAGTTWLDLERFLDPIAPLATAEPEPAPGRSGPDGAIARAEPAAGVDRAELSPAQTAPEPLESPEPAEPVVAVAPPEAALPAPEPPVEPPAAVPQEPAAEPAQAAQQAAPDIDGDLLEAAEVATARVMQPPPEAGFEDEFEAERAPEPAPQPVIAEAPPPPASPKIQPEEAVTLSALLPPEALSGPPPLKPAPPEVAVAAPSIFTVEPPAAEPEPAVRSVAEALREPEEPALSQPAVLEIETEDVSVRLAALPPDPTPGENEASAVAPALESLETAAAGSPPWQRFAALEGPGPAGAPMVALVIDDLGLNGPNTRRAVALPGPLTLAFLTYAPNLKRITAAARERGHELMLHLPMEPEDHHKDPGPKALLAEMGEAAIMERLTWALARFEGYVGLNNHMGSKFTASGPGMAVVLAELRRRGLLYLDSVTSPETVGGATARKLGVPYVERDVFLDNEFDDPASIRRQLARLESIAREQGYAVGIGHPHRSTLSVLADWIPAAEARGLRLSPVSAIVRRRIEIAAGANGRAG